jgi:hypothetical protein
MASISSVHTAFLGPKTLRASKIMYKVLNDGEEYVPPFLDTGQADL